MKTNEPPVWIILWDGSLEWEYIHGNVDQIKDGINQRLTDKKRTAMIIRKPERPSFLLDGEGHFLENDGENSVWVPEGLRYDNRQAIRIAVGACIIGLIFGAIFALIGIALWRQF